MATPFHVSGYGMQSICIKTSLKPLNSLHSSDANLVFKYIKNGKNREIAIYHDIFKESMVFSFCCTENEIPLGGTTFVCSECEYQKRILDYNIVVKKKIHGSYSNLLVATTAVLLSLDVENIFKIFIMEI